MGQDPQQTSSETTGETQDPASKYSWATEYSFLKELMDLPSEITPLSEVLPLLIS